MQCLHRAIKCNIFNLNLTLVTANKRSSCEFFFSWFFFFNKVDKETPHSAKITYENYICTIHVMLPCLACPFLWLSVAAPAIFLRFKALSFPGLLITGHLWREQTILGSEGFWQDSVVEKQLSHRDEPRAPLVSCFVPPTPQKVFISGEEGYPTPCKGGISFTSDKNLISETIFL